MRMREALEAVLDFAGKKPPYDFVHVFPPAYNKLWRVEVVDRYAIPVGFLEHGCVAAGDGQTYCMVFLDPYDWYALPRVCLEAKSLRDGLAALKSDEVIIHKPKASGVVNLHGKESYASIVSRDVNGVPEFPIAIPASTRSLSRGEMDHLRAAVHAVSKDAPTVAGVTTYLHVHPHHVEGSDGDRIARVIVPGLTRSSILVSPDIFRKLPKGEEAGLGASFGIHEGFFCLQVGEQYRTTRLAAGAEKYPDITSLLEPLSAHHSVVVSGKAFSAAVKAARKVKESDVVELMFGAKELTVRGVSDAGEVKLSYPVQYTKGSVQNTCLIPLRGRLLQDPLSHFDDDYLTVGFSNPSSPVKLSSQGILCVIWPLIDPTSAAETSTDEEAA